MRKFFAFGSLFAAAMMIVSCNNPKGVTVKDVDLNNDIDSVSYSLGMDIATSIKGQGIDALNYEAMVNGFEDVFAEKETKLSSTDAQMAIRMFMMKATEKISAKNLEIGKAFLEENGKKEGVVTLPSGLQYKVITEGKGATPKETDKVRVHYRGTLIDGQQFDSSYDRNEPAEFGVNQVIKGWVEALQLMKPGAKWQLFIPSELAYGVNPHPGGIIKPNMVLLFDVELLEIVEK